MKVILVLTPEEYLNRFEGDIQLIQESAYDDMGDYIYEAKVLIEADEEEEEEED